MFVSLSTGMQTLRVFAISKDTQKKSLSLSTAYPRQQKMEKRGTIDDKTSVTYKTIDAITKTRLNNFDPLKPHFYIVKLGFTGVYIIFLISVLSRNMKKKKKKKKNNRVFLSQNFKFLEVKLSVYLNRRVFVMQEQRSKRNHLGIVVNVLCLGLLLPIIIDKYKLSQKRKALSTLRTQ